MTPKPVPQGFVPVQEVDQQAIVPHNEGEQLTMDLSRVMDYSLLSASGPDPSRAEGAAEPRTRLQGTGRLVASQSSDSPGTPYGKIPSKQPYRAKYDYTPAVSSQVSPDRALLREKVDKLEFAFAEERFVGLGRTPVSGFHS